MDVVKLRPPPNLQRKIKKKSVLEAVVVCSHTHTLQTKIKKKKYLGCCKAMHPTTPKEKKYLGFCSYTLSPTTKKNKEIGFCRTMPSPAKKDKENSILDVVALWKKYGKIKTRKQRFIKYIALFK